LPDGPSRDVIYRYSKGIRGADEAVKNLFEDVVVIDDNGKAHKVPIVWGPPEKAVAVVIQENVRKDNSLVVDALRIPIMSIYHSDYTFVP